MLYFTYRFLTVILSHYPLITWNGTWSMQAYHCYSLLLIYFACYKRASTTYGSLWLSLLPHLPFHFFHRVMLPCSIHFSFFIYLSFPFIIYFCMTTYDFLFHPFLSPINISLHHAFLFYVTISYKQPVHQTFLSLNRVKSIFSLPISVK